MPAPQIRRLIVTAALALSAAAVSACHLDISDRAEARDQWQRRYTLSRGGLLEIRNTNGLIHIESTDGDAVEVTADRIVQASTDAAAKDGLAKFSIDESVAPDHVTIDSANRNSGLFINMSRKVDYHVRLPAWTNVKLDATNGDIEIAGPKLTGTLRAEATNGRIRATGLENSTTIHTTNGAITLDVNKLGEDGISCETTNGAITVLVPPDLGAKLSARVSNGAVSREGIDLAVAEESRHRIDGTMGAGGPLIKLETTNGMVQIKRK